MPTRGIRNNISIVQDYPEITLPRDLSDNGETYEENIGTSAAHVESPSLPASLRGHANVPDRRTILGRRALVRCGTRYRERSRSLLAFRFLQSLSHCLSMPELSIMTSRRVRGGTARLRALSKLQKATRAPPLRPDVRRIGLMRSPHFSPCHGRVERTSAHRGARGINARDFAEQRRQIRTVHRRARSQLH